MDVKEDIRIQKTKRDLRNSITSLIIEKPIEKITVKEICDKAMVNRMTFYKYFEDKYQLLDDVFYEMKNELIERLPIQTLTTGGDYQSLCADILEQSMRVCDENIELLHALKKNANQEVLNIITNISESSIADLFKEINKVRPLKYSISFISSFIYGGFLAAMNYWLDHPSARNREQIEIMISDLRNNVINYDFVFKD